MYIDPTTGQPVDRMPNVDPAMLQQVFGTSGLPDPFAGLSPSQQQAVTRFGKGGGDLDIANWAASQLRNNPNAVMTPSGGVEKFSPAGERSGTQFARAMNLGMLNEPGQVNLADMGRYIMQGGGQPYETTPEQVRQRAEVMRSFLGTAHASQGQQGESRQLATDVAKQALAQKRNDWDTSDARNIDALVRTLPPGTTPSQAREVGRAGNALRSEMGVNVPGVSAQPAASEGKKPQTPQDLTDLVTQAKDPDEALRMIRSQYSPAYLEANTDRIRDLLEKKYGQTLINRATPLIQGRSGGKLPFSELMSNLTNAHPTDTTLNNRFIRKLYRVPGY